MRLLRPTGPTARSTTSALRRRPAALVAALLAALLAAALTLVTPPVQGDAHGHGGPKPTVVLVHGAFADASGWSAVQLRLQARGYTVYAPANPLRGIEHDAETLRLFLDTLTGPVVLVGHSYGGAVITNAATGDPDVQALVYVAAYAPAEGESLVQANELGGGHTDIADHLVLRPYPGAPEGDADGYIDPAFFRELFAADLPRHVTEPMAYSQRPAAVSTLFTPSGAPAWAEIPSWYLVAGRDKTIPPEAERAMAKRAGAVTREVRTSHVPMMSRPDVVTDVVLDAVRATS